MCFQASNILYFDVKFKYSLNAIGALVSKTCNIKDYDENISFEYKILEVTYNIFFLLWVDLNLEYQYWLFVDIMFFFEHFNKINLTQHPKKK